MSLLRNPTEEEVVEALKGSTYLRVLRDKATGDFFVWPNDEGLPQNIKQELNLDEDAGEDLGLIKSFEGLKNLIGWVGGLGIQNRQR